MPNETKKRVIMIMIHALSDQNLQEALKEKKAPALQFFIDHGHYLSNMVSPFPTVSVNVESTILTGHNNDRHKIPGLIWYSEKEKRLLDYNKRFHRILQKSVEDLPRINKYLSNDMRTIHEVLHENRIRTASIGAHMFRGNFSYELTTSQRVLSSIRDQKTFQVQAPEYFSYGAYQQIGTEKRHTAFWQNNGLNDQFATEELLYLLRHGKLPPFILLTLPDLERSVKKYGRFDMKGIEKVNGHLEAILNAYTNWEDALRENIWIIIGNRGHAWLSDDKKDASIDLRKLFKSYKIANRRKEVTKKDELAFAINERMAYIYPFHSDKNSLEDLTKKLQLDNRIAIIAIKKGKWVTVTSGLHNGFLRFSQGGPLIDQYGQSWTIEGNKNILNLSIRGRKIEYGNYPDALARLDASFSSHEGTFIIVSANPGHLFVDGRFPTYVGRAASGGLHKQDSLVATIVSGTDSLPNHHRLVDMKDWILSLLLVRK
ncbi:alkaline phosphatase family protein [Fervidibacillus albus]|uniref:Alkaline phosphatase family protein n=1 Tax=Fervidibacillus albus TaxID=2980026 RepID=A0A9E8RU53_9BACI|nr:alkaline phosphatase family protein [Fervidibacillus albus]WAA08850.1 alkaline phosphatase family protein [Fervidibacillus albus]